MKILKINIKERQSLAVTIIIFVICYFIYAFVIVGLIDKITQQKSSQQILQQKYNIIRNFAMEYTDYIKLTESQNQELLEIQSKIVSNDSNQILDEYFAFAENVHVKIIETEFLPPKNKKNNIQCLPIRIELSGDFFAVMKFIDYIEHNKYNVAFENVNINGEKNTGIIKVSAILDIYQKIN